MFNTAPQSHPAFGCYRKDNRLVIRRPLRKDISSQLALSSFKLLSLKTPISRGEGMSNEEVTLYNSLIQVYGCVGRAI